MNRPPLPRNSGKVIKKLYAARDELRNLFFESKLPFPLDGMLIGDIGEAIAIYEFGLKKLRAGTKLHDFETHDGRMVQIKATQKISGSVGLGREKQSFVHLIVFQIFEDGTYSVLFDGPGSYIDEARKDKKSASLSVLQLKNWNERVKSKERILSRIKLR